MFPNAGQNGQWVRTRTDADAKAFMEEKRADQERSLHRGTGSLILAGVIVLFVAAAAIYSRLS